MLTTPLFTLLKHSNVCLVERSLDTTCVAPQLKHLISRGVSRCMNRDSRSSMPGAFRLATSFASSFSIEKYCEHRRQTVDFAKADSS